MHYIKYLLYKYTFIYTQSAKKINRKWKNKLFTIERN